jgi:RNA-directed DNA polymerase
VVVKTDISKFYQSTTRHQVFIGLIREFKCSGDVAMLIADSCTYQGHVPTGSPASMLLAFYAHKQPFDAQYLRAMKEGRTFTLYVDDITLSGESVNLRELCSITKTLRGVGLKCHKTHLFEKHSPKPVTGAIITDEGLRLPNRRHLKIAQGISSLGAALTKDDRESISRYWGK